MGHGRARRGFNREEMRQIGTRGSCGPTIEQGEAKPGALELLGWAEVGNGVTCIARRGAVLALPPAFVSLRLQNGA